MTVPRRTTVLWLAFALSAAVIMATFTPVSARAAVVLADSYPESNFAGSSTELHAGSGVKEDAQSFTALGGTLDSARFYLRSQGAISGHAYAKLYVLTGDYGVSDVPTGAPLAISAPVDVSTISGAWGLVTFQFDNTVPLSAGAHYFISVAYDEGGNESNYLSVAAVASAAHPGAHAWLETSWINTGYDLIFYVFETPRTAPPVVGTPASSAWSLALLAGFGLTAVVFIRRMSARE